MTIIMARSIPFIKPSYVRFFNRTERSVIVKWSHTPDSDLRYSILRPHEMQEIGTFETHAWICEDEVTKTGLLINKSKIFYPASENPESSIFTPGFKKYENAYISLPVLPLMDLAAEVVIKSVKTRKDVLSLKLPSKLELHILSKGSSSKRGLKRKLSDESCSHTQE